MDIWETNKLLLFVGFVIPGFISLKTYELLLPSTPKESAKQLIDAVAYSCINYALLLWPIFMVETGEIRSTCPSGYRFLCICVVGCFFSVGYPVQGATHKEAFSMGTASPDCETMGLRVWATQALLDYCHAERWEANRRPVRLQLVCFMCARPRTTLP